MKHVHGVVQMMILTRKTSIFISELLINFFFNLCLAQDANIRLKQGVLVGVRNLNK